MSGQTSSAQSGQSPRGPLFPAPLSQAPLTPAGSQPVRGATASGISFGLLLALSGFFLFGTAHVAAGLVFVILGFVSMFTGMASHQERKRLVASRQLSSLGGPGTFPSLPSPPNRFQPDPYQLEALKNGGPLPAIPVPFSMQSGEYACYRTPATLSEVRQLPRLGGGIMTANGQTTFDDGELYVTTRRIFFSGSREVREFVLEDIASARPDVGAVELWRRGRPCPTLLGVADPLTLATFIDRARAEMAAPLPQAPTTPDMLDPGYGGPHRPAPAPVGRQTMHELNRDQQLSFVKCANCGAANGLSANFCQTCGEPIGQASMPTLNHPGPR